MEIFPMAQERPEPPLNTCWANTSSFPFMIADTVLGSDLSLSGTLFNLRSENPLSTAAEDVTETGKSPRSLKVN